MSSSAARRAPAAPRARAASAGSTMPARAAAFLQRKTWHDFYNDVVFIGLMLALAFVPLRFGSNDLGSWGINALLFGSLLILFEGGILVSRTRHPVAPRRLWWVLALLVLVSGWALLQVASFTPASWHNPFWDLARGILERIPGSAPVPGSISVSPDAGIRSLIRLLTTASAFYLALQLCRDNRRADLFLTVLVAIGIGYALVGLIQFLFFPDSLLWIPKQHYLESLTGSFVNRNNYATFAGICLIATIGLLMDVYRRAGVGHDQPLNMRLTAILEITLRNGVWLILASGILFTSLVLTSSRAGVAASLCGIMALICLLFAFTRRRGIVLVLALPVFVVLVAMMIYFGDNLAGRISSSAMEVDRRYDVISATLAAVKDAPWFGFGYGSFSDMFSVYKTSEMWLNSHWNMAHNTYAELLFDLGVPAALAIFVLCGAILGAIFLNVRRRETRPMISLVALAASVTALLHATVDFSLQIQGFAVVYWALIGAGLAQSWSRRIDTSL